MAWKFTSQSLTQSSFGETKHISQNHAATLTVAKKRESKPNTLHVCTISQNAKLEKGLDVDARIINTVRIDLALTDTWAHSHNTSAVTTPVNQDCAGSGRGCGCYWCCYPAHWPEESCSLFSLHYSGPDPAETDQFGPPRPVHEPEHIDLDYEWVEILSMKYTGFNRL